MRLLAAALLLATATGCHAQTDPPPRGGIEARPVAADAFAGRTLLSGERIAIVTTDDRFRMSLTDHELRMGVTERLVEEVEAEVEREVDADSWLGRVVTGAVSGALRGVMTDQLAFDLADVHDVRYIDGRLQILLEDDQGRRDALENVRVDDQEMGALFEEKDARAFVRAFREITGR